MGLGYIRNEIHKIFLFTKEVVLELLSPSFQRWVTQSCEIQRSSLQDERQLLPAKRICKTRWGSLLQSIYGDSLFLRH